ncbi:MAG: HAMP domain-containing histidine kinase [Candidatus Eiseniibacteriota bacterium]|nr:MAG: HAMP domain-containing histidine kinase [Candidatus Eisenbacteria bacterium]
MEGTNAYYEGDRYNVPGETPQSVRTESLQNGESSRDLLVRLADLLTHELLDSIGVIKVYTEILLNNEAAPVEEFLNVILENTEKVDRVIQEAIHLARSEANRPSQMARANQSCGGVTCGRHRKPRHKPFHSSSRRMDATA